MIQSTIAPVAARPDFSPNCELPRHRWYRFKEGFSAGLVNHFIEEYLGGIERARLLDPFLGSGTTALEGAKMGHNVDGVETNPFIAFVAKVKTRDYSHTGNIEDIALQCLKNKRRVAAFALPDYTTLVERPGLSKWLLNKDVAIRFEELRTAIAGISSVHIRNLLLLALISSIEEVANARKDGKCWRYKRGWKELGYDSVELNNAFAAQVLRYVEDISILPRMKGCATVTLGDARHFGGVGKEPSSYDALLTSPPYLNSFDYTDIYRPELLLLKMARHSSDLRDLRLSTLRSHVQIVWNACPPLNISLLQRKIRDIDRARLWNVRIPDMINAYFVDLDRVISRCAKYLKVGAVSAFVVADSAYSGVVIPVDQILAEILDRRGFTMKRISLLRQTLGNGNHQQHSNERLREVIVAAEYKGTAKSRLTLLKS